MGKIKDAIIKKLGGHTRDEMEIIRREKMAVITQFDIQTLHADICIHRDEVGTPRFGQVKEHAKKALIMRFAEGLEPYVEIKDREPKPPNFYFGMVGTLRVISPETWKEKTHS